MKTRSIIIGIMALVVLLAGMASAADGLKMKTDKNNYDLGEGVVVTIKNVGGESETVPYCWIENSDGEAVYAPDVLMLENVLGPGESVEDVWDQTDDDGKQVEPGHYTIRSSGGDSVSILIKKKATGVGGRGASDCAVKPGPVGKMFRFY